MENILKENIFKKTIRIARKKSLTYHQGQAYGVSKILKEIEPDFGNLSKKLANECNSYAIETLGHIKYAPWLYVYSVISGQFREGWIPPNFYQSQVIPKIKGHYGDCSYLKPLNTIFFQTEVFPDLGSFVNGFFLDRSYQVHSSTNFENLLFENCDRVVFKSDHSLRGQGIHIFDKKNFNTDCFKNLGNGVFQSYVNQHPLFNEYTPGSVATIRITTAIDDEGKVSVRGSFLRLGAEHDTYIQSETAIKIPIDIPTGTLNGTGYMPSWATTCSHPASLKSFAYVQIPNFDQCVNVVTSLHMKIPFVRCVGWDVTLDQDGGVVVLEWNGEHNGISFTEATQGPCFVDLGWERFR